MSYSYYAEASGWELGELPFADIRHSNTFPAIEGYRPHKSVYHPIALETVEAFERVRGVYAGEGRTCGMCSWTGPALRGDGSTAIPSGRGVVPPVRQP